MMKKHGRTAWVLASWLPLLLPGIISAEENLSTDIPLVLDYRVTQGAAPGYIEDRACAVCHYDTYKSYQQVGMARSFYRPGSQPFDEDFENARFFHVASKRHYEMTRNGDRLFFRRYLLDREEKPIHEFECEIDWIMGSGNHSRTYIYQTELGELFQLPIQWYSQTREWGMAPGFDREDHQEVGRPIRRECIFCHNAYPEVPVGSDDHRDPHLFPKDLPEGIGCQRCHGPGAEHVRVALAKDIDDEAIRSSIVNPMKLQPELRDDVCNQCHLQPTVAFFGVRRFDRSDYSYRPGESLPYYLVQMEVDEQGRNREERFEINHHAYRLHQSPCFIESKGEMNCINCHDPHHKIPVDDRAAHYQQVCLKCHSPHDPGPLEEVSGEVVSPEDCVTCHMPKRRPQDVVHVIMTDHRIGVYPDREDLTLEIAQTEPILTGLQFYSDRFAIPGLLGEVYKAVAVLRAGGNLEAVEHLQEVLKKLRLRNVQPYLDLIEELIERKQYREADSQLEKVLSLEPREPLALEWKASVEQSRGNSDAALERIDRAIELNPNRTEAYFNRGLYLFQAGRFEEAKSSLKEAIVKRPNFVLAHYYLGKSLLELKQEGDAIQAFQEALDFQPAFVRAAVDLGNTLIRTDRRDEAARYLMQALQLSTDSDTTAQLVDLYESLETLGESNVSPEESGEKPISNPR